MINNNYVTKLYFYLGKSKKESVLKSKKRICHLNYVLLTQNS
jgi:hypothetical protein